MEKSSKSNLGLEEGDTYIWQPIPKGDRVLNNWDTYEDDDESRDKVMSLEYTTWKCALANQRRSLTHRIRCHSCRQYVPPRLGLISADTTNYLNECFFIKTGRILWGLCVACVPCIPCVPCVPCVPNC